ncbi:MAG: MBL fold metallo-hydrolase [Nocardioidaceae bacterium]
MRLTHIGHACLLVEAGGQRILVDPGNYARDFRSLTGLDAIAITHQHLDHADPARLPALVANNPDALLLAEPQTARHLPEATSGAVRPRPLSAEPVELNGVTIGSIGETHALIHPSLARVGNRGLLITAEGEPVLFHPGDSYDADPGHVDILALPINAPWANIEATAEFVRRIQPRYAVPIHDGLLSRLGRELYLRLIGNFGPDDMQIKDLCDGEPVDFD